VTCLPSRVSNGCHKAASVLLVPVRSRCGGEVDKIGAVNTWRVGLSRIVRRSGRWVLAIIASVALSAIISGWRAFGHRADGERRARMERSPAFHDGSFVNPEPLHNDAWLTIKGMFTASPDRAPKGDVPVVATDPSRIAEPPKTGLRVTWLGHSSLLVDIDGARILTDPVWSGRVSPIGWVGPERWYEPTVALGALPKLDAVVVSHDHYDHLDYPTIVALNALIDAARWGTKFVVPLGVGAHLVYWGVPETRIVEVDWWDRTKVGSLEIVCVPARHASGRTLFDKDATLWAGYAFLGAKHRAYFSGDTGLFPAMRDIGARLGPFDVTMIEVGEYDAAWPDWHIGPEQAVDAHRLVRGRVFLPIHWALLNLAYHGWTEPIERAAAASDRSAVTLVTPRPGESIELDAAAPARARWWPDVPWKTAEQDPIVSSQVAPVDRTPGHDP